MHSIERLLLALVECGSHVRGDSDSASDRDYCAITEPCTYDELTRLRSRLAERLGVTDTGIAIYTVDVLRFMANKGSLFVWHLRDEGRPLFNRAGTVESIFASLKPYMSHHAHVAVFSRILDNIERDFQLSATLTAADLSTCFTLVRNTCMLLSHAVHRTKYGRRSAFDLVRRLPNFPIGEMLFDSLCDSYLRYSRGIEKVNRQSLSPDSILADIRKLLLFAESFFDAQRDSATATASPEY